MQLLGEVLQSFLGVAVVTCLSRRKFKNITELAALKVKGITNFTGSAQKNIGGVTAPRKSQRSSLKAIFGNFSARMDITLLFKACIKTIKTKNRAFGQVLVESDKARILHGRHPKQEFTSKSKEIVQQVTRLHDFLAEHQRAYLNFANYLSELPEMSDAERDKIDMGAQKIIHTCSNFIRDLEREVTAKCDKQSQILEHQLLVVAIMREYLKQVCKVYSEQRAIRVQRTIELKKLSQIGSGSPKKSPQEKAALEKAYYDGDNPPPYPDNEELSPDEIQMFELENKQLYDELNSLTDEVQQIESKVVKIAELQELFTEKVLEQDRDMDRVASMVVGTTENVKDANDLIRRAIQRNAGLRVWVLFFLLVMSFSLLFLDWYND